MAIDSGHEFPGSLYLCEPITADGVEPLRAVLGLPVAVLGDVAPAVLAPVRRLVIDVDLHDVDKVRSLRRALSAAPTAERIFLLEGGLKDRAARVQAEALGASQIVPRQDAVVTLMRGGLLPKLALPPDSEACEDAAIRETSAVLARLFDGLLDEKPASIEEVASVGNEVLRGVARAGRPTEWLEEVRVHHQGTFQHCLLVAGVSAAFAASARLSEGTAATLMSAAILHDIGKAGIPLHILDKPGRLDPDELAAMRRHPELGHAHLLGQKGLSPQVLDAVLHHHELLDGSGYPHRLKNGQIWPLTRVLTVCDIFAALVEHRPYKATRTPEQAMTILLDMARAGQVDMQLVQRLVVAMHVDLREQTEEVYRRS